VITFALESHGYVVFTADNGKSGIDFLLSSREKIDLILLDMMLPDMYGLEALEKIKNIDSAKNIPIIMQTGTSNYEDLKKAVKLGAASEVIHKPYCRADLIQVVEVALEKDRYKISKIKQASMTI
jgi:two-component system chemotaxis sensor kinase CheA